VHQGKVEEEEDTDGPRRSPPSQASFATPTNAVQAAQRAARRTKQLQDEIIRQDVEQQEMVKTVSKIASALDRLVTQENTRIAAQAQGPGDIIAITDRMLALSREIASMDANDPRVNGL